MEVYVIKRDDGKYWCGFDGFIEEHIFSDRISDGLNTQTPTYEHCSEEIEDYELKNCKVVKATIFEGTLEQHDAEVKKQERERGIDEIKKRIENYTRRKEKKGERLYPYSILQDLQSSINQLKQEDINND